MYVLAFAESIQLFPDGTIFIHVALILIMIWVLNRTLYRPINNILEARERSTGGQMSEASTILSDVQEKEARYSRELLEARSKGYELIEQEQLAAAQAREKQLAEVRNEIAGKLESGRTEIQKQTEQARAEVRSEADRLADSIAASILKK